jgi:hypothetical protein
MLVTRSIVPLTGPRLRERTPLRAVQTEATIRAGVSDSNRARTSVHFIKACKLEPASKRLRNGRAAKLFLAAILPQSGCFPNLRRTGPIRTRHWLSQSPNRSTNCMLWVVTGTTLKTWHEIRGCRKSGWETLRTPSRWQRAARSARISGVREPGQGTTSEWRCPSVRPMSRLSVSACDGRHLFDLRGEIS